ncbi:MAG: hypothetical protein SF028_09410 [Candidatus Sumerlaeia bacterium]|nr:hypothetical protein [Candidatus Sumerlaeia bacterium]
MGNVVPAMLASVFTPTHHPEWLAAAAESLLAQSHRDWEWIVLPNGTAAPPLPDDPRIRVLGGFAERRGLPVGQLKRACCGAALGAVLVELDHDDLLHPEALAEVVRAVGGGADFVFSNFAEFHDIDGSPRQYPADSGWRYRDHEGPDGHPYREALAYPADLPWLCHRTHHPNHIRAWSAEAYRRLGGHDPALALADDFDLLLRTYAAGMRMEHLDRCLYYYRWTGGGNTSLERQAEIANSFSGVYARHAPALYAGFCARHGLDALELAPEEAAGTGRAPGSAGLVTLRGWIRELGDLAGALNECWRILAPGGVLRLEPPAGPPPPARAPEPSRGASPALRCAFSSISLARVYPTPAHRALGAAYLRADLSCVKRGLARNHPVWVEGPVPEG